MTSTAHVWAGWLGRKPTRRERRGLEMGKETLTSLREFDQIGRKRKEVKK